MKRVLVTGATGFIGRQCLPRLVASAYEVHAASSTVQSCGASDITWHRADLLDHHQAGELVAAVQPTHLLHLAWYTVPGKFWTSHENVRWVQASLSLLQAFGSNGGQRVVMAGTCAEYDWQYGYCSERVTPLVPTSFYGVCKHALQLLAHGFSEQAGLSSAWARFFFLYGPHEHPARLVSSAIRSLLRGEPVRCSHGNQTRDYLHVEDAAAAAVALLDSAVAGPVNVASGRALRLRDIISRAATQIGRADLVHLGAIPAPPDDPPLLVADVRRLHEELGWSPHYDLDAGLEQTVAWWRSRLVRDDGR
jgi:nucleoside-diphosphate-sugar epimerase